MNKKGFTLTELMAVIVIIAIIILIAVPSIMAINKNMNKRVYEKKKETIITAAEIYANNNPNIFDNASMVKVFVRDLIALNYLSYDVKNNDNNCINNAINGNNGCMLNPVNKESMNNDYVILIKKSVGVEVEYYESGTNINDQSELNEDETLVQKVCNGFKDGSLVGKHTVDNRTDKYCVCGDNLNGLYSAYKNSNGDIIKTNTSVNSCIISGDDVNNYLKHDGVMWRVIGLYNLYDNPNKLVAKMITDDIADN